MGSGKKSDDEPEPGASAPDPDLPRERGRPNVWVNPDLKMKLREGVTMEAFTMEYGGIGWAVAHMQKGWKLRRDNWPNGVFIAYIEAEGLQVPGKLAEAVPGEGVKVRPMLLLRDTGGHFAAYVASQTDLLAHDWKLVDAPPPGHSSLDKQVQSQKTSPDPAGA